MTFKREDRYIVLKISDVRDMLSHATESEYTCVAEDIENLERIAMHVVDSRAKQGKPPLKCVVVESDWPEYEAVFKAIEQRVQSHG